ncbi:MAG: hypothetical protein KDD55_06635 [Bdellovibrionales bacterium]|nr:hypothetical protein [Bdellovibrionales bacterium]
MMRSYHLLFILVLTFSGCKESILHDLSESDANRILTRLHTSGIVTEKEKQADGRWSITVPKNNAAQALQLLAEARVFRRAQRSDTHTSSLLSSREEQRFYFERALSREIESTLISLDGVLEARVHMNLPPTDPLFGKRFENQQGTGSAMLVVSRNFIPQKEEIALLISGASGIAPSNISVLLAQEKGSIDRLNEPTQSSASKSVQLHSYATPATSILDSSLWDSLSWNVAAVALGFLGVCVPFIYRRWRKNPSEFRPESPLFVSLFDQSEKEDDDINVSEDATLSA